MKSLYGVLATVMVASTGLAQQTFDLDPNFRLYDSDNWYIASVCPLPDGKMLISGWFDYPFNMGLNGLARLLPSGFWDYTFEPSNIGMSRITPWNNLFYISAGGVVRRILDSGILIPIGKKCTTAPTSRPCKAATTMSFRTAVCS